MGKIEDKMVDNLTVLTSILGAENVEDMKKRIADLIVKQAERDLRDYGKYILYPPDFQQEISEAYDSVSKKIAKMYKDALLEAAQKSVDAIKDSRFILGEERCENQE